MATPSDGYQVKSGLGAQATELDGAGDDAGKIAQAIFPAVCYPDSVLGGPDAGPAFNAYAAAWEAEAKTLKDALHELAKKVRGAKGAYGGSDGLVRTNAARIDVGGARNTGPDPRVPAPAPAANTGPDPRVTTQPAPAERPSVLSSY
ncbi:hypothetical protein ACFQE4_13250 [Streptomyces thermocoprophilus]|uniref:Excreted virulence factor EspC (Type VII ESX diderm) n=1 Tax=Streptomyces thermocoprophilus TaxID=78356 RepID=A0ABV5VCQ3_9ACTN